ncbi:MAG: Asp23/Gls24 family envelope stress response protein [Synergistaceae bacterium]|nr:Asp23/Gls24 family envelope stress response protein [Synergistaceae bacterium]
MGDKSALAIARHLQRKVRMGLSYFTGMDVKKVNVSVREVFL